VARRSSTSAASAGKCSGTTSKKGIPGRRMQIVEPIGGHADRQQRSRRRAPQVAAAVQGAPFFERSGALLSFAGAAVRN
jgi:hypothetical protein